MKAGMPIPDLLQELDRQRRSKRDYVAPTTKLTLTLSQQRFAMRIGEGEKSVGTYPLRRAAHQQLAERLKIPWPYYERCLFELDRSDSPDSDLLAQQVNYWLHRNEEKRMIRTLDGEVRAFLSDRFRPLDNWDLFSAVAPVLRQAQGIRIESANVTAETFYIKAMSLRVQGEVRRGEVVQAGICIFNSEVGKSSVRIEPAVYILACTNGMIMPKAGLKRHHVGRGADDDELESYFTERTRDTDSAAFWLKVRDVATAAMTQASFGLLLQQFVESTQNSIPRDRKIDTIAEVITKKFDTTQYETESIMRLLYESGDLTQWGLSQAVTRHSQDIDDYDRATALERIGGQVIELQPKDWTELFAPARKAG